jgi:NTP pyrophosphatase (non-canonical NTP hydrolase)
MFTEAIEIRLRENRLKKITELQSAFDGMKRIASYCYNTSKSKGWWEGYADISKGLMPDVLSSKLMLIVSEISEALEEIRKDPDAAKIYYTSVELDSGKVLSGSYEELRNVFGGKVPLKPEGFGVELADIIIRVFDLAEFLGINLPDLIHQKMVYNDSRSYKHGGKSI